MLLKQLTDNQRSEFELALARGCGWEDAWQKMLLSKDALPAIRKMYFKAIQTRKAFK